jgi:hypothetical protein
MMSIPYVIYQAERDKTLAEQRAEARARGEMAALFIRPWRALRNRRGTRPFA